MDKRMAVRHQGTKMNPEDTASLETEEKHFQPTEVGVIDSGAT